MNAYSMWRNPNSELVHSPEDFACFDVAFPLLLAWCHHRHCDVRLQGRCQLRCPCSPLRCATPRNCYSRSTRPPSIPSIPRPSASSFATLCQIFVGFCLVACSDARAPNPHCSPLCRSSKPEVSEVETKLSEGGMLTLNRGGQESDPRSYSLGFPYPKRGFSRLLALARRVLFTVAWFAWFPSPVAASVEHVVVDSFNDAARMGTPSSCSLRAFFRKFACRNLSYSGTSAMTSLPNPSSDAWSSDPLVSSSSVSEGAATAFVGVSIARASKSTEACKAFERPCHRHFQNQVRAVASVNMWT